MTYQTKSSRSSFKTLASLDPMEVKRVAENLGHTVIDPTDQNALAEWKRKKEAQLQADIAKGLQKNRQSALRRSNLATGAPVDFTFADWKRDKQKNAQLAFEIAKRVYLLANELKTPKSGFNLVFWGTRGSGKTSLAMALVNELKSANKTAVVVNTAQLADKISESYGISFEAAAPIKQKLHDIERGMIEADVLVLDDLGIEGGMGEQARAVASSVQKMLYRVADARCGAKGYKATITTTNDDKSMLKRKYAEQIVSRLLNVSDNHAVDFTGLQDVRGY